MISLDFELMWGVRDHATKASYGHRVLGERKAIPAMLDLFERNGIHATWATVGFLMCDGLEELFARAPKSHPSYADQSLSNYSYMAEVGNSEREDPYYFAPSMIRAILQCPHQELATHSFSHYYCLEPGQTDAQFRADLRAATRQLRDWQVDCRSIVFPRNQYAQRHLAICAEEGLTAYRGTEAHWMYRPANGAAENLLRRAARLADSYVPLSRNHAIPRPARRPPVNVPSSRFLRPVNAAMKLLDDIRLRRITSAMEEAAITGSVYHLWWHPHNFGADIEENIAFLAEILECFRQLAGTYGMQSASMAEVADAVLATNGFARTCAQIPATHRARG